MWLRQWAWEMQGVGAESPNLITVNCGYQVTSKPRLELFILYLARDKEIVCGDM